MNRLTRLNLLELCLSNCYLLVLVFRFVFCPVPPDDIAIFLYFGIMKYFCRPNFSKS